MSGTLTVGKLVLTNTTSNQDAFDRLRVSNPVTLFENQSLWTKSPLLIDEKIVGTATVTMPGGSTGPSYIEMIVNTTGDKAIRQSFAYIPYQPGKSKLMFFTGVFETSGGIAGIRTRIGCFDDIADQVTTPAGGDGFFFELDGTTMYIVKRSSVTGSQVDTAVAQSSWNVDTFNGNGPSRITITTWDTDVLMVIDQEWLGVGRVRVGIMRSGVIYYANYFENLGLQTPYTRTGKLPVRYEIENVSALATTGEMRMMCSTVMSEGGEAGFIRRGLEFNYVRTTSVTVAAGVLAPIIALRLTAALNRVTLRTIGASIIQTSANSFANIQGYIGGTLTGASWTSVGPNSAAEIDVTASSFTGGTRIESEFIGSKTTISTSSGDNMSPLFDINSDIAGTSQIFVVVVQGVVSTSTLYLSLQWAEFT